MADDGLEAETGDEKDRSFVTALARGLDILRCFKPNDIALTNRDFAERTGLPKATISRLTHTLCALEYLIANPDDGSYRLSAGVLQLGFAVLSAMDINHRVQPELRRLRDGPNSFITAACAEQFQLSATYLASETSREDVSLLMRIGSRLPLFHSAIGRAILVELSEADQDDIFRLARRESKEVERESREQLKEALQEFGEKGFCSGYGTWRSDVNGIAVPVRSLTGSRVYGLNVGGPAYHVSVEELESIYAPMLHDAARALSGS